MTSPPQINSVPEGGVAFQSPDLFRQVRAYPFSTDPEFQRGLRAILDSASNPEEIGALTLDAQCFYYARKHALSPMDFNAYRVWLQSQPPIEVASTALIDPPSFQKITVMPSPSSKVPDINEPSESSLSNHVGARAPPLPIPSPSPATYPPSFSQIVDLITNGQPIPGIKEVPDTLLSGQESRAVTAKRKKPWEKDEGNVDVDDVVARSDAFTNG